MDLSALRSDFSLTTTPNPVPNQGTQVVIRPAVSTFSDHIVISFPLEHVYAEFGEQTAAFILLHQSSTLLGAIAGQALRLGFLFRGGATIGRLHHEVGVVFGEAMVEAFKLELQTAIFPRVVLSPTITRRSEWMSTGNKRCIARDDDGIFRLEYFSEMLLKAGTPGERYAEHIQSWFKDIVEILRRNLVELERAGKLNPFSKWAWFARQFRAALEKLPPQLLTAFSIPLDELRRLPDLG